MGWLTPDTPVPSGFRCRRVRIPDSVDWLAFLNGALLSLTESHNWEEFGTMLPRDVADKWFEIWTEYSDSGDWCMIGSIFPFASATVPAHTLECDGSTYLRVDYPDLYATLDSAFIVDADNFIVPDLRGNVVVGANPTGSPAYAVNQTGGEVEHVLTTSELASHTHVDSGHTHPEGTTIPSTVLVGVGAPVPTALGSAGTTGNGIASLSSAGSDTPHNNLQPYCALRYAIVSE